MSKKTCSVIEFHEKLEFFRLSNIQFEAGSMNATLYFYDLDKSYDVILSRFASL